MLYGSINNNYYNNNNNNRNSNFVKNFNDNFFNR